MYVNSPVSVCAFVCKVFICGASLGTAQVAQRTARCVRAPLSVSADCAYLGNRAHRFVLCAR